MERPNKQSVSRTCKHPEQRVRSLDHKNLLNGDDETTVGASAMNDNFSKKLLNFDEEQTN